MPHAVAAPVPAVLGSPGLEPTGCDAKPELDETRVTEVLIRGEGMRYGAHDALPAGRHAVASETDTRVTVLDFGTSRATAK